MSVDLHAALGEHSTTSDVGALSRTAATTAATTACEVVDAVFRGDPDLVCLAVPRAADAQGPRRWGLVSRSAFMSAMAGRLGYGRTVHARRPVADLTDWDALVLPASTTVEQAAQLVLRRDRRVRYSEVLVLDEADPHAPSYLEVEDVLRALAAGLSHQALSDQLTGLANRTRFLQLLGAAAADERERLLVAYVDVDGFKSINDSFGHGVGDQVLQVVAQRLRCCVRPDDVVARLGGDEFALIVRQPADDAATPDAAAATSTRHLGATAGGLPAPRHPRRPAHMRQAHELAERLLECLTDPVHLPGRVLPGRVSIGVVVAGRAPVEATALLHEADLAMYRAKAAGGSRCAVVDDTASTATVVAARAPDRGELQRAAAAGEFVVHYQPIVDVVSGALRSTEALVRWQHPQRGLLAPAVFLGDVATAGLAAELDLLVLRSALAQHARWRDELGPGAPEHLNVNLSVAGLLQPDLAQVVLQALEAAGLPPRVLRLELSEVATPAHVHAAGAALGALRTAGVGVTLDDVGTGAAGIGHLADLHLDGVKIDRRFVAGMLTDERDAAVVRMLVEMAHGLGIAVTAEGAETEEHLEALRTLARGRPTHVQGFVVSRPLPAHELSASWPRTAASALARSRPGGG